LGKVREISKSETKEKLAAMLRPSNAAVEGIGPTVNTFLNDTFFCSHGNGSYPHTAPIEIGYSANWRCVW
jgi:hypothetical protein